MIQLSPFPIHTIHTRIQDLRPSKATPRPTREILTYVEIGPAIEVAPICTIMTNPPYARNSKPNPTQRERKLKKVQDRYMRWPRWCRGECLRRLVALLSG